MQVHPQYLNGDPTKDITNKRRNTFIEFKVYFKYV